MKKQYAIGIGGRILAHELRQMANDLNSHGGIYGFEVDVESGDLVFTRVLISPKE